MYPRRYVWVDYVSGVSKFARTAQLAGRLRVISSNRSGGAPDGIGENKPYAYKNHIDVDGRNACYRCGTGTGPGSKAALEHGTNHAERSSAFPSCAKSRSHGEASWQETQFVRRAGSTDQARAGESRSADAGAAR